MATPFTLAKLQTELSTDPAGVGYAASVAAGNDAAVAALINAVGAGGGYVVNTGIVPAYLVLSACTPSELLTRTALQTQWFSTYLSVGSVDTSNANVQAAFLAIFDNSTAPLTRAALTALVHRQGSRAEVLWGTGVSVTVQQIGNALRGTS